MHLEQLKFNLVGSSVRRETLEGRSYLVVPVVMLTEGVHNGTGGPLYYPSSELSNTPSVWDHKPIVVYHPTLNGNPISACRPEVIEAQRIGILMNTKWDGKLRSEAWIDEEKADKVDDRVLNAIHNNQMMEVSTGLFTENQDIEGEWNGESYTAVARFYKPDHLAILPDQIGACSIKDGAGLLQLNTMSNDNIHSSLSRKLRERNGASEEDFIWIVDVYSDGFFIYEDDGVLYRLNFEATDTEVTISGTPEQVVRVTEYRTVDGAFVGNTTTSNNNKEDSNVEKKKVVDGLIANKSTKWEESDRKFLMGLEGPQLEKLEPVANADPPTPADPPKDPPTPTDPPKDPIQRQNSEKPPKPQTVQEYIDAAPPDMRGMLQNGLSTYQTEKTKTIETILANERNQFSKDFLEGKELPELKGIEALLPIANNDDEGETQMFRNNYAGAGGGPENNNSSKEEAMEPVSWSD